MRTQVLLTLCLSVLLLSSCTTKLQRQVDAELSQLCAQDGGIKVYETVTLPPEMPLYVKISEITFRTTYKTNSKGGAYTEQTPEMHYREILNQDLFDPEFSTNALGPDYIWKNQSRALLDKTSEGIGVHRIHYQLVRRADKKLLGEIITYLRLGNGVWSESRYSCPVDGSDVVLLTGMHLIPAVFKDNPENLKTNK